MAGVVQRRRRAPTSTATDSSMWRTCSLSSPVRPRDPWTPALAPGAYMRAPTAAMSSLSIRSLDLMDFAVSRSVQHGRRRRHQRRRRDGRRRPALAPRRLRRRELHARRRRCAWCQRGGRRAGLAWCAWGPGASWCSRLPGRSWIAPGHSRTSPRLPGVTKKCTREAPSRLFYALFSDSRSRDAPGAIFERFWVARGRPGRLILSLLPVFRKGRAFFVRTPGRPRNRSKIMRK